MNTFIIISFLISLCWALPIPGATPTTPGPGDLDLSQLTSFFAKLNTNNLEKRGENVALTEAFTALNQTGQGVALVEIICTNSLTQSTVLTAIAQYLKQENMANFFTDTDTSNLAVDITMLFFEDRAALSGLIKIILGSGVIKLKRDLIGDLTSGLDSITSDVSSGADTALKGISAGINDILGNPSNNGNTVAGTTTISTKATNVPIATAVDGAGAGSLTNKVNTISATLAHSSGLSVPTATQAYTPTSSSSPSGNTSGSSSGSDGLLSGITSGIGGLLSGVTSGISSILGGGSSSSSSNSTSSGGLLSGIESGIGDITSGVGSAINGTTSGITSGINGATSVISGGLNGFVSALTGILNSSETAALASIITLINNDKSTGDIMISLDNSGLGVSVVQAVLTNSQMQSFAETLVEKIKSEQDLTLSRLVSGLQQSNLIGNTFTKIVSNKADVAQILNYLLSLLKLFIP